MRPGRAQQRCFLTQAFWLEIFRKHIDHKMTSYWSWSSPVRFLALRQTFPLWKGAHIQTNTYTYSLAVCWQNLGELMLQYLWVSSIRTSFFNTILHKKKSSFLEDWPIQGWGKECTWWNRKIFFVSKTKKVLKEWWGHVKRTQGLLLAMPGTICPSK